MSKAPIYDFTLGSTTLAELGISHLISSVVFEEEMGKFDSVDITILDGPELATAYELVQHGSALQLSIGYHNIEVLPMTVCFLKGIQPDYPNRRVKLKFVGYLKAMDVHQRDRSLNERTIREVVAEVLLDYPSMKLGTIDNGDLKLSATTTQSKQTDFKLLEGIADTFGMRWKVEPSDEAGKWFLSLYKMNYDKTLAEKEIPLYCYPDKYHLLDTKALHFQSFSPESNILGVASNVQIRSNNPDQPIVVDSSFETSPLVGTTVRGSDVVATVFGVVTQVHFYENVTDEAAAQIIADQLVQDEELSFVVAKNCQMSEGNPRLRVGGVRQIYPKGISLFEKLFEGVYFITKTRHTVDTTQGYDVTIDVAMNSLTVPPPPEQSFGGGSGGLGIPVLINIPLAGNLYGWYVHFDNGVRLGAEITDAEIRANAYWMGFVSAVWGPTQRPLYPDMTPLGMSNEVTTLTGGQFVAVRIDWPATWSSVMAVPLTPEEQQKAIELENKGLLNEARIAEREAHAAELAALAEQAARQLALEKRLRQGGHLGGMMLPPSQW